jgi:hypothetical protein
MILVTADLSLELVVLSSLLDDVEIEPLVLGSLGRGDEIVKPADVDQAELSSYWFRPTYRGWQRLWDHHDAIMAYWAADVPQ